MDDILNYLKDTLLSQLLQRCQQERILRIWMVGQTTAEEPYLLALLLADLLGADVASWNIKLFATYSQEEAVAEARRFTFSEQRLSQLPPKYQQQFFERVDAGNIAQPYTFALAKPVRHLVIFGFHSLLYHPPLSHLHLLVGLHALDSFPPAVQQAVLGRFATSLTGGGLLLLGSDASVQPHPHVYELVEPAWNLYRCRAVHPIAASNLRRQSLKLLNGTAAHISPDHLLSSEEQEASEGMASPLQFDGLGIVLLDGNSRIMFLDMAAARLLGVPKEVIGQDFGQTVSGLPEALVHLALQRVLEQHVPLRLTLMAHEQRPPLTLQFAKLDASAAEPPLVAVFITDARQLSLGFPTAEASEPPGGATGSSYEQLEPLQETLVNEQLESRMAFFQETLEEAERVREMLQVANEELQATNEELEITGSETAMDNLELRTVSQELRGRLHEQMQARQQLEQLNRLKDDFIGIASHEIKTPLTGILGNVQLALRHVSRLTPTEVEAAREQQKIQQALQRTEQHIHRLNRLLNDMLDAFRIEANSFQFRFDCCDLTSLLRDIVEEQRQLTSGQPLVLSLPEHTVRVVVDADRIGQVVNNYLSNALKYSPDDQPIEVRLQEEDQAVRLLVRDQGPGLSLPEQKRVWERFYRVPGIGVQNGSEVGLGLGLAICHYIIVEHGGMVGVESVPGQGATFWFTLPITT